jgi:Mg/Co/Ni transporter MgtE
LPFEGDRAAQPHLATLADKAVLTCGLREKTREVGERVGDAPMCVVVDEQHVVLGVVTREVLNGENAVVDAVMEEAPRTFRPYKTAAEVAKKLDELPHPWVLVTTLDGKLVGSVDPAVIRGAA